MKVILLEKIRNLGDIGEHVNVKPGYARNFLVPQSKAVFATRANILKFEEKRAELEEKAQFILQEAQARAEKMKDLLLNLKVRASAEGKLFGSVAPKDIANLIQGLGHIVQKNEIVLSQGIIRTIGTYPVQLHLHPEVSLALTITLESL